MTSTNTNCLEGVRCPQCGQGDRFFITATIRADVTDGGADIAQGSEMNWDDQSMTICPMCDKDGPLSDFRMEPERPPAGATEHKHRILITVEGGVIQDIENIPPDTVVEVCDFDKNGNRSDPIWCEKYSVVSGKYVGPDLPASPSYLYRRGRDGADETFDIYRDGDRRPLVSFGYWDQEAEAEATARLIVEALNQHAAGTGREPGQRQQKMRDVLSTIARMQMDGEDGFELSNDDAVDSLHSCIRLARDALA